MPRRGENIYKRKDGRWEGRYKFFDSKNHKTKYKSVYAHSYTDCKEKLKEVTRRSTNENLSKTKMTVKELFDIWLIQTKLNIKYSSYVLYKNTVYNHIIPYMGNTKVNKINLVYIEEFKTYKLTNGRLDNKGGLSQKTVLDILVLIKSAFKYAQKKLNIYINIDINEINIDVKKDVKLTVMKLNEQLSLERYIKNNINNYTIAIKLCLYTGIRLGEVCCLKVEDFDFENETISINKTVQRIKCIEDNSTKTKLFISTPKSETSRRELPLPSFIIPMIKKIVKNRIKSDFVFSIESKKPLEPRTLQYAFSSILKKCNINKYHFHSLRHTFATHFAEYGFDTKSLSEILGHSSINITLSTYVHSSFELKKKYINLIKKLV